MAKRNLGGWLALWLCILLWSGSVYSNDEILALISHKDTQHLDLSTFKQIYALKQKLLPNGARVRITVLPPTFKETVVFSDKLFNFYPYQLFRIWDTQVFSGKASMPYEVPTVQQLIEYVANTQNAVGYVIVKPEELERLKEQVNVVETL